MSPLLFASRLASQANMNGISAFVQLVKALAWPVTVLVIIFKFRDVIKDLILSIHKIKYGELELTMKRELKEVRLSLETRQLQPLRAVPVVEDRELSELMAIAQISPRSAVTEAWTRLEAAGAAFVQRRLPPDFRRQSRPPGLSRLLEQHELLPSEVINAIQKLRDIRNRTVHSPDFQPSVDDAEEYVLLTNVVIQDLERIGHQPNG
jgi:hypothetical protein